jgi:hypothetical protein
VDDRFDGDGAGNVYAFMVAAGTPCTIALGHRRTSARRHMPPSTSLHVPITARNKIQHRYSANAQSTTSPMPANHKTTSTIVVGSSKNLSYARTILPLRMRTPGPSYTLLSRDLACVGPPGRARDSVRSGNPYPRSPVHQLCQFPNDPEAAAKQLPQAAVSTNATSW